MKKKYLLFVLSLGLLTACDPIKEEGVFDVDDITSEELLEGATFEQFDAVTDEEGNVTYVASETGNYIKYDIPAVASVYIYYINESGSEITLSYGSSGGMFSFFPTRGSDSTQTVYFRFINQNGEEVTASREFTLTVSADLTTELKLLVSDDGTKVWKWNTNAPNGYVWGNMGTYYSDGQSLALTGDGEWWGVTSEEEFLGQLQHTDDGLSHGDESMDATMVFSEDGTIICYDAEGNQIRSGSFSVSDYDASYGTSLQYCGILNTDAGSILFPYEINSGGNMPTQFYIAYLSPGRMVLVYPDDGDWDNSNGEATFWQFKSESDIMGCLTDNDEATWEWDDDSGQCWGNASYADFVAGGINSVSGNTWWGGSSSELDDQIENYGYGFDDAEGATMTFTNSGVLTKSSGGSGTFSYNTSSTTDLGGYGLETLGTLSTTGDGILFAQRINASDHTDLSSTISEFDIVYISDDNLVLAAPSYFSDSGGESWQECTFWRFKKVE